MLRNRFANSSESQDGSDENKIGLDIYIISFYVHMIHTLGYG